MSNYCFLNGKILPIEEAKVSVLDIGLLRGYGIYDGLAAIGGKPFRFKDHFQRFLDGAHILNLNVPITEESCEKKIIEILDRSEVGGRARPLTPERERGGRANVRMILTGGDTISGIEYDFENPTFYITLEKWTPLPEKYYKDGAKLVTYEHMREMPEHKTINYIKAVNLQDWKKSQEALEILYVKDGEVLECATSNICIVKGDKIITPDENVLRGVTLKVVGELSSSLGFGFERGLVDLEDLKSADEVFITSSFKDIVPVVKIDDSVVGSGEVGSITKSLMAEFAKIINF